MISLGDYRQLSDALFHAGTDSGSEYEYIDEANGLAFYVLDRQRDEDGVLSYKIAVRSLANKSDVRRGVRLGRPDADRIGKSFKVEIPVTNTGAGAGERFDSDIYRIQTKVRGHGWKSWRPKDVMAVRSGERSKAVLYVTPRKRSSRATNVFVTVRSESDPSKAKRVKVHLRK